MPALNKRFWIAALREIHGLTLAPNPEYDWKSWSQGVLRKAEQHLGEKLPADSTPNEGDEEKLQQIFRKLDVPDGFGEEVALDRMWHLLKDDQLQVDDEFHQMVFFLLYRLVERRRERRP